MIRASAVVKRHSILVARAFRSVSHAVTSQANSARLGSHCPRLWCAKTDSSISALAMLGRVVGLQLLRQAARFRERRGLVQRRHRMRVQVVHYQDQPLGSWIVLVRQLSDQVGQVLTGAALGGLYLPLPSDRFKPEEQILRAIFNSS